MEGWRKKIGRVVVLSLLLFGVVFWARCSLLLGDLSIPGENPSDGGVDMVAPLIVHVTDLRPPGDLHAPRDAK